MFTDAELSTHLGQCGALVDALRSGADAAIGSRRETSSVVVKKGKRNTRGKLFIYLWKRLLPSLRYITDTQCGFKAFRAERIRDSVEKTEERRFAFDIELLLLTELRRSGSIARVPVAWIDSEAASTTTDIGPYLSMLQSVVGYYRCMLPTDAESDGFAELIASLDEAAWQRSVEATPATIADADPQLFGAEAEVSAATLAAVAGL